jgi:hypothetical protein
MPLLFHFRTLLMPLLGHCLNWNPSRPFSNISLSQPPQFRKLYTAIEKLWIRFTKDRIQIRLFYVVFALGSGPSNLVSALDTARASYYQVRSIEFAFLTIQNIKSLHRSVLIYARCTLSMRFFVATCSQKYLLDKIGSRGRVDNYSRISRIFAKMLMIYSKWI